MIDTNTILVADDNPRAVKLLSTILCRQGYRVLTAQNGEQVVKSVKVEELDLILMDIHMPKMDGYEACRRIKAMDDYKAIPIIFVSAMTESFNKVEAYKAGGIDYIQKPFQMGEILSKVKTHLDLYQYQKRLLSINIELYKQLKCTFEQAAVGIGYIKADDGRIIRANDRFCSMLGYTDNEMLAMTLKEIIHPDSRKKEEQEMKELTEKKIESYSDELQFKGKDKIYLWVQFTLSLVTDTAGKSDYLVGIFEDISKRKKAEKELQDSEKRFQDISYSMADWIWEVDKEGCYTYVGIKSKDILEYDADELLGESLFALMPEDEAKSFRVLFAEIATDKKPIKDYERWNFKKSGEPVCLLTNGVPRFDEKANLIGYRGVDKDITKRMQIEKELAKSEHFLNESQRIAHLGSWVFDIGENNLWWSDEVYRIFNLDQQQFGASYEAFLDNIHPDERELVNKAYLNSLENKTPYEITHRLKLKDGTIKYVHEMCETTFDDEGKPLRSIGTVQDITERKKAEEALRKSEERLRAIGEASPDLIFVLDEDGYYLEILTSQESLLYKESKKLKGRRLNEVFEKEKADTFFAVIETTISSEKSQIIEYELKVPAGLRYFEGRTSLLKQKIDEKKAVVFVSRDITEKRTAEQEIRKLNDELEKRVKERTAELKKANAKLKREITEREKTEEELNKIFNLTVEGLILIGCDYRIQKVNNTFLNIFSLKEEEVIGTECSALYDAVFCHIIDGNEEGCGLFRIENGLDIIDQEIEITLNDSEQRIFIESSVAVVGQDGAKMGLLKSYRDITNRKKDEQELSKLSQAIEQSPASVVITNIEGEIEFVNEAFCNISGYCSKEVIGENSRMFKAGNKPKSFYKDMWDTILDRKIWRGEFQNISKSGKVFWENASIAPIMDDRGEITHFVAVKEDITERKKSEEALLRRTKELQRSQREERKAKEEAETANLAKSEFLANMSHELRTPLNAVIGFSEILEDRTFGPINEKQEKYVKNIQSSGRHLLNLINDVLDLAKIEAGRMGLEFSEVSIKDLIDSCLKLVAARAAKQEINLETDINKNVIEVTISADEIKLRQVLLNLLSNSIKFTPPHGTIELSSYKEQGELFICVSDTGIGLKNENLERIFLEFEQVDTSFSRKHHGTGLGLTLSRKIIELHGGRIWAESKGLGKGSQFTFTIPIQSNTELKKFPKRS